MLEVAIPATVPVGEARDVVAVIAPYSDASGLRELLTADWSYSALPDDVRRQPFHTRAQSRRCIRNSFAASYSIT